MLHFSSVFTLTGWRDRLCFCTVMAAVGENTAAADKVSLLKYAGTLRLLDSVVSIHKKKKLLDLNPGLTCIVLCLFKEHNMGMLTPMLTIS